MSSRWPAGSPADLTAGLVRRGELWVTGFALSSMVLVFANRGTTYVADNRFEQYWNPFQRLRQGFTIWDSSRGLGWVREEFWPATTAPIALLRWLGFSPGAAEHLAHAALLTLAGLGAVAVMRLFDDRRGWAHALAGLLYAFGPYSTQFLVPSNLYVHYAVAPWFVVLTARGLRNSAPWPTAAAFALVVFVIGNVDQPGFVYDAVPIALTMVYVVVVERSATWRDAGRWVLRAGVLCAVVSASAFTKTAISAAALGQRLETTEAPSVAAKTSSWAESLRGLGFWVSYFVDHGRHVRESVRSLVGNPFIVLTSFAPLAVAAAALRWRRDQASRLLFGALLFVGAFLMVGAYPADSPSLWGRLWLAGSDRSAFIGGLRSTYKAGATFSLGLAGLVGLGAVAGAAHASQAVGAWGRRVVLGGVVIAIAVLACPLWQRDLYFTSLSRVPDYWIDAFDWLDARPGAGQVLFLPGSTRSVYRWGVPGDDIQDSFLQRPHVMDISIPISAPLIADLLQAVDDAALGRDNRVARLAPVLRRLGVRWVVLRNDLDWRLMNAARPTAFAALRRDPELELVKTFGRRGENTVGTIDEFSSAERRLHPVEIFEVRDSSSVTPSSTRSVADPVIVDGAGTGWPELADAGFVDHDRAISYAGATTPAHLRDALDHGGEVVVTDSNRRVAQFVNVYDSERSRTLAPSEDLGHRVPDLFEVPGSQSVAVYRDATRITDRSELLTPQGRRPEFRPALAVDGDESTRWIVPGDPDPRLATLELHFRRPTRIDRVSAVSAPATGVGDFRGHSLSGSRRIGRAVVEFSDGPPAYLNLIAGQDEVRIPARTVRWARFRIRDVTGAGDVALAELSFPGSGLDLRERIQAASALRTLAERDPSLRRALERAPTSYLFERLQGHGSIPIETQLRRRFWVSGTRLLQLSGTASRPVGTDGRCRSRGLLVDGRDVALRVSGRQFTACEPLPLEAGWHDVEGTTLVPDSIRLATLGAPVPKTVAASRVESEAGGGARVVAELAAGPDTFWVLGQGYDPRWTARLGSRDLGAPVPIDGQTAWRVPASDHNRTITAEFGPQRVFRMSLTMSSIGVIVCVAIALRGRQR